MILESEHARIPAPPSIAREPLRIGGLPVQTRFFLAPLAGYTSLAFRSVVRSRGGLGLASTDLVNARSLLERRPRSFELTETTPEDRPLAIQIYGSVVEEMARAARMVVDLGASIVDINMGCPVRKVVRTGGGSALMCEADSAARLVEAVVRAVDVPVSVKMRLGWDDDHLSAPDLARLFERVGAAMVIVHGRTRAQGFRGRVNLEGIRAVVEAVERIPVIGNGDVRTIADVDRMFRSTGCAAVSIGRGALANPCLFRQLHHWSRTGRPGPAPDFLERVDVLRRHFHGLVERRGERFGCLQFRKLIKWYGHWLKMPRPTYLRLINIANVALFEDILSELEQTGPNGPLPDVWDAAIPVPSGPIDKW